MSEYRSPSYFGVHNYGTVIVDAFGNVGIIGDYTNGNLTRIDMGTLIIYAKARQVSGVFEIRDNASVKVSNTSDNALRIERGTIAGQGTIDANLTLGFDPLIYPVGQRQTDAKISPSGGPDAPEIGTLTIVHAFQIFDGTMAIDVNAAGLFDKVIVQGQYAALAGTLTLSISQNYKPAQLVHLDFLRYQSVVGDFTTKASMLPTYTVQPGNQVFRWTFIKTSTSYAIYNLLIN